MSDQTQFNSWALVELFGHQQIAGLVSEQQIAGAALVRVDVPEVNGVPAYTKFYGLSAIYAITPLGEAEAKLAAEYLKSKPINAYMLMPPTPIKAELEDYSRSSLENDYEGGDE